VSGVGNGLVVTAGPGLAVTVDTGFALVRGGWINVDTQQVLAVASNSSGSTRIDRAIVRMTVASKLLEPTILPGTPGAGAPLLTQNSSVWEMPLAQITVTNGAVAISSGDLIDQRPAAGPTVHDILTGHSAAGLTAGQYLKATGATTFGFATIAPAEVGGQPVNLLDNGGFEVNQRPVSVVSVGGAYPMDRWSLSTGGGTASLTWDTAAHNGFGVRSALLSVSVFAAEAQALQDIEDAIQYRGATLTLAMDVLAAAANRARIAIWDNVLGFRYSSYHTGGGGWERLSVTAPVSATATGLRAACIISNGTAGVSFDNAMLVVGSVAVGYAPLDEALELQRCRRYYQVYGIDVGNEMVATGQCYSTTQAECPLLYRVPMFAAPTVTLSAANTFQTTNAAITGVNLTAITADLIGKQSARLTVTVASGLVAGNATILRSVTGRIALEANP
jgi:hypothetical protein